MIVAKVLSIHEVTGQIFHKQIVWLAELVKKHSIEISQST